MSDKIDFDFTRKIRLGYSDIHGRGVFATEDIKEGELIERCPIVTLSHRMNYHKDPIIWGFMFTNTCPCEECKKHGGHFLMVLGYAQLYNHQDDNSAAIKFMLKEQYGEITALRDIKKGDEIFINYGPKYFQNRNKITIGQDSEAMSAEESPDKCATQVFKPK